MWYMNSTAKIGTPFYNSFFSENRPKLCFPKSDRGRVASLHRKYCAYKKMPLLQGRSAELSHHFHVFLQIFAFDKSGCLLLPVEGERFQGKLWKIFET